MTMLVSAKTFSVMQFVAIELHRIESTAVFRERLQRNGTAALAVGVALGLQTADEIQHFPRLGLGKRLYLLEDLLCGVHDLALVHRVLRNVTPAHKSVQVAIQLLVIHTATT